MRRLAYLLFSISFLLLGVHACGSRKGLESDKIELICYVDFEVDSLGGVKNAEVLKLVCSNCDLSQLDTGKVETFKNEALRNVMKTQGLPREVVGRKFTLPVRSVLDRSAYVNTKKLSESD